VDIGTMDYRVILATSHSVDTSGGTMEPGTSQNRRKFDSYT
jgi:hypothetical protein